MKKLLLFGVACCALASRAAYYPDPAHFRIERDIRYAKPDRCVLDVLCPPGKQSGWPTVVWFHGGGLTAGDKRFLPLHDDGIAQVAVRYPFLEKDGSVGVSNILDAAAQAVAWTFDNITSYGGDTNKIFVGGHSAGGYITMMIGLDSQWLGRYGHRPGDLCGLVPVSGQATTHFAVRKARGDVRPQFAPLIDSLAPLYYVDRPGLPPIDCICGDPDFDEWKGRAEENELLIASMKACGHKYARYWRLPHANHTTVLYAAYGYIAYSVRDRVHLIPYRQK